jgi:putative ABC transport system permease protein
VNIAWLDVRHHLLRFVLTANGVGLLLTAMIGMIGLYRGVVYEALIIIEDVGADLWITQGGRAGPFAEESSISGTLERRIEGLPGVVWSRNFIQFNQQFQIGDRRIRMAVTGLDYPADTGSWVPQVAGHSLYSGHYEAIADRSLGLPLGARIRIARDDYTIVGITAGQVDMAGDGIFFVTISDARTIRDAFTSEAILLKRASQIGSNSANSVNRNVAAVMVKLQPGADVEQIKDLIRSWGDVEVYSRQEQEDILLNSRLWRLRLQILAFVFMTLLVTIIVVGLSIYTMTLEKVHQIALLKLIGARDRFIVMMIVQQALIIGVSAFFGALLLAHLLFPYFPRTVLILRDDMIMEAGMALLLCVCASWFGIRKAMSVRAQDVLS